MKKTFLIVALSLGLAACGTPTVEDFKKDQDKLKVQIEKCNEMKRSEIEKSEACQNAASAYISLSIERNAKKFLGQ